MVNFAGMRRYEDTYKQKGLRKQLVDSIRQKGITDENVLAAIGAIPRHFFLDTAFESIAYDDRAFPIGEGQTISQPYTVAYQTQLLEVKPYEKVLEIGTGSAYQACVLAELKANVFTPPAPSPPSFPPPCLQNIPGLYSAHSLQLYPVRL